MAKIPISSGVKAGWGFFRLFKMFFFLLFFVYLLISIVLTGFQEKDFGIVVKELGEEFYNPLQNAQEFSLELQGKESIGIFSSIWDYWGFYFNLAMIYLWIFILKKLMDFFFRGTTPPIARIGMALILFLGIQMLFGAYYLKESPNFVFIAIKDIFNGLVYLFTNHSFSSGSESLISSQNTCNDSICVV